MAQPLYIQSTMASMASALSAQLAARQIAEFKALASETAKTSVNMQALLHPISSKEEDLGPYNLELSTLIPPLTMLLMTLCVLVPLMMLKFGAYPLYKQANHIQVFTSAALIVFGLCVIFSLFGALVFLAFKGPNYNTQLQGLPINGGRFFKIWMSYLLTLLPTMLWLKSLSLVVPTTYAAVPSVMTIIPNVCSAIVALELCPPFFKWFQAMPFFQGCMLTRYVVSGAHNRLGENLGVLFGELAFSLLLLFACTALHQRNVCLGVVNFMGNYNITWSDTAVGKRKPVQQPAPTTDRILESGDQPQRVSFSSEAVPITDEYTTAQDTMRNRTLAI
ncbi:hypothetical protein GGF49_001829 [Coemansia sp. RSA 1853]|nr:hypothetical protein GGF49_001829 [Coemansia sp. RSA 1853]